jgi:hypothetical protein
MFVFAGGKAVDNTAPAGTGNVLHASFLAHADGISTMGAGVAGEVAYLHRTADSKARLGALPIKGHNEQAVNAKVMEKEKMPGLVDVLNDTAHDATLQKFVDDCVEKGFAGRKAKYAGTMEKVIEAVNDPATYTVHAANRLFKAEAPTQKEASIKTVVDAMAAAPITKATRRLNKVVIQIAERMIEKGDMPKHPFAVLSQKAGGKPVTVKFDSFKDFVKKLGDPAKNNGRIDQKLQDQLHVDPNGTPFVIDDTTVKTLPVIREFFADVLQDAQGGKGKASDEARLRRFHEFIGELTKTGF